jgi:hypothetical protein
MAEGLFMTPEMARQAAMEKGMLSSAQMAQLPLLNQVAAMGGNAGAMIGSGLGGLLGMKAPGEAQAEAIRDISARLQQENVPQSQKYGIMAQELSARGFENAAMQFSAKANEMGKAALEQQKMLGDIENQQLTNTLNRATLVPKIQASIFATQQAEQDLEQARLDYAQAQKTNPLEVQQAAQTLRNSQLNYDKTLQELNVYNATAPSLVAEAQANASKAVTQANKAVRVAELQQTLNSSTPGTPEYDSTLKALLAIESPSTLAPKTVSFGTNAEATAKGLFNTSYSNLSQEQAQEVNKQVQANRIAEMAAQGAGTTSVTAVNTALNAVEKSVQPYLDKIGLADQVLTLSDLNTPKADEQVNRFLATMAGDKQLSMAEVNSIANRNGFVGSVAAAIERFMTGKDTPEDRREKRKIVKSLREAAYNKANYLIDRQKKVLSTTNLSPEQVDAITNIRPKPLVGTPPVSNTPVKNNQDIEQILRARNMTYNPEIFNYRIVGKDVQQTRKE